MFRLGKFYQLFFLFLFLGIGVCFFSKAIGALFVWCSFLFLFLVAAIYKRAEDSFVVLTCALATSPLFQISMPIGYRLWHYVCCLVTFFLIVRSRSLGNARKVQIYIVLFFGIISFMTIRAFLSCTISSEFVSQLRNLNSSFACLWLGNYVVMRMKTCRRDVFVRQFFFVSTCCLGVTILGCLFLVKSGGRLGMENGMDPNGLGYMALAGVVSVIADLLCVPNHSVENRLQRLLLHVLVVGVSLVCILLTASRSAFFLFLIVVIVPLFASELPLLKKIGYLLFCFVVMILFFSLAPTDKISYFQRRVERSINHKKADRLEHVYLASKMIEKSPFFGNGAGSFKKNYYEYRSFIKAGQCYSAVSPHNLFAMFVSDYGYVGLLLILLFVLYPLFLAFNAPKEYNVIAFVAFAVLLGRANAGVFLDHFFMSSLGVFSGFISFDKNKLTNMNR
jgi:O-antigen ligase